MAGNFSLVNKTRASVRGIPFSTIKKEVLGDKYELSVALLTSPAMQKAMKYKDSAQGGSASGRKASNVLAFPLSKHSGEILLCPATARAQAGLYGMTPKKFLIYLFIHGCLHLKGMHHGGTMERTEQRFLKDVSSFTHAKNSNRNRHRHLSR